MIRFKRPLGVTIVAILVWLQGLLYIAGGLYVMAGLQNPDFVSALGGTELAIAQAVASFAFSLVLFGVASGLLRGSPRIRILLTVLLVISVGGALYSAIAGYQPVFGPITAALAVAGMIFLWTPRARAFFRPEPPEAVATPH